MQTFLLTEEIDQLLEMAYIDMEQGNLISAEELFWATKERRSSFMSYKVLFSKLAEKKLKISL